MKAFEYELQDKKTILHGLGSSILQNILCYNRDNPNSFKAVKKEILYLQMIFK